jgi:hypothetical protein
MTDTNAALRKREGVWSPTLTTNDEKNLSVLAEQPNLVGGAD